eukprot:1314441-Rhodomonas_salina.2
MVLVCIDSELQYSISVLTMGFWGYKLKLQDSPSLTPSRTLSSLSVTVTGDRPGSLTQCG